MNFVSKAALGAAIALCGTSLAVTAPVFAQEKSQNAKPMKLNSKETPVVAAIDKALAANDHAAAAAAIAAAEPVIQTPEGKLALGTRHIQLGVATKNTELQAKGIDLMLASGIAPANVMPDLYLNQANLALAAKDLVKGEAALQKLLELRPTDYEAQYTLAQIRVTQKRVPEGLTELEKAIAMRKAASQPVPEDWYTYGVGHAERAKLAPQMLKFSEEWLRSYPSGKSWRALLLSYTQGAGAADKAIELDTMRLMRAAKALVSENDYYRLSRALTDRGYPGEAKAVLDEGVAAGTIKASEEPFSGLIASANGKIPEDKASLAASEKSALAAATGTPALKIGDAFLGYGDYAKAITLYRAALQKGGVDADLVNTHLGLALALSGQKAEAEAALKAISGPRSGLATYMLLWLSQRAA